MKHGRMAACCYAVAALAATCVRLPPPLASTQPSFVGFLRPARWPSLQLLSRPCVVARRAKPDLQGDVLAVRSAEEAADALSATRPEVLACFLDRGERGEMLAEGWRACLADLPLFDVAAVVSTAHDGDGLSALCLEERLPAALHTAEMRPLIAATLDEAQALVEDFRLTARDAASAPDRLRVRLACLDYVQCSRFHWDDVPLRAVSALAGEATQVLPESCVDREALERLGRLPVEDQVAMSSEEWNSHIARGSVTQPPAGWVALLRGSKWPAGGGPGVVHRSPGNALVQGRRRVLLQVDYADAVGEAPSPMEPSDAADPWSATSTLGIAAISVITSAGLLLSAVSSRMP